MQDKNGNIVKPKYVADVVCPICFYATEHPTVLQSIRDRYGREIREYFQWCYRCNRGANVVQFLRDDRWHIHKYQLRDLNDIERVERSSGWVTVSELPEPAPVVIGPGGDYMQQIELQTSELIESAADCMINISNKAKKLLDVLKQHGKIS